MTLPMWKCSMNPPLITGKYYHIYNRGVEKRTIFQSRSDYQRLFESINFYRFYPTPRKLSTHLNLRTTGLVSQINQSKLVRIICFCFMPNHIHLLVQQLCEGGISEFMRRLADSYTRFYNTKYNRVGPLFQGKFKAKIVETDEYLLQLSKYIHRNPLTLPMWKQDPKIVLNKYSYSSYPLFQQNQQATGIFPSSFCEPEEILNYFNELNSHLSYQSFVEESEEIFLPEDLYIDFE